MSGKQGISALVEEIHRRLLASDGTATLNDLIDLLNNQAGVFDLSTAHRQAHAVGGTIILRCDGSHATGLAHVRRCLSIARSLAETDGLDLRFAVIGDREAADTIRAEGFAVDIMPEGAEEIDWLLDLADYHRPIAWLLDVRTALTPHAILRLRATDTLVAVIDDVSARRLVADAAFYPPLPQVFALDWSMAEREPCVGWEWVPMDSPVNPSQPRKDRTPHVVVAIGGADPQGLSLLAVRALSGIQRGLRATIVLSANAPEGLERRIEELQPRFGILRAPDDLATVFARADLALVGFGTQAWDLAAAGIPALYACMNDDHEVSAAAFARAGMGVSLGSAAGLSEQAIANAIEDLLDDPELLRSMSAAGRMNLDGRGAARIATRLLYLVDERRAAFTAPAATDTARTGT